MVTSISKSTLVEDIWKNFYDRMKAQVTSVTITGSVTVTVQNYVSEFSDKLLSTQSNYPIIVVSSPVLTTDYYTASKDKLPGTIDISVLASSAEAADKFLSKIIDSVETYRPDLRTVNMTMVKLDDTDPDMVERSGIKIHSRRARYSFEFRYTKS